MSKKWSVDVLHEIQPVAVSEAPEKLKYEKPRILGTVEFALTRACILQAVELLKPTPEFQEEAFSFIFSQQFRYLQPKSN